jgi:heat-inducible transcriptional repressor
MARTVAYPLSSARTAWRDLEKVNQEVDSRLPLKAALPRLAQFGGTGQIAVMTVNAEKPADPSALAQIDARARDIFRRIVDSYLVNGEPVGSRMLSRTLPKSLSPASVRNVMQDLEEIGLIYAPHTSAGRMPTQLGLRFYVDALLELGSLGREERARIESQARAAANEGGFEGALAQTTSLISALTRGAGVVLTTKDDVRLKQIEFVRLEAEKALAVIVSEDGSVVNRIVGIASDMSPTTLAEAANYVNAHARGRTLAEARSEIERAREAARGELDALASVLVDSGLASWAGVGGKRDQLIVRGSANLLGEMRAEDDLERIRLLFSDLETQTDVIDLLHKAENGDGVKIFIGSENKLFSLSGSSMIVAPLKGGDSRVAGVLGVIGPTRLNYGRIVPLVEYAAQVLGEVLSDLKRAR